MLSKFRGGEWLLCVLCTTLLLAVDVQGAAVQDTLILRNPENISARVSRSATSSTNYTIAIVFDGVPKELGALIFDPNLAAWSAGTPAEQLSEPAVVDKYNYLGTIDRTIEFRALNNGTIGVTPNIRIQYSIRGEEQWQSTIDVGQTSYSAGDPKPIIFRNSLGQTLDLGIDLSFSEGVIDSNGVFFIGCQDFEGYHIWRGVVQGDGSIDEIEAIGEISKEEAFDQSFCDSLYFESIIPALRSTGRYVFFPGLTCFNIARDTVIELPLADNQFFWIDYNAFNGYTYAYAVSTFDRGYSVSSGRQGLVKFDSFKYCAPDTVMTIPCQELFTRVPVSVDPQEELRKVYAVPNPYRSGSSVYTTPNYHNYPDEKIRFVNVPTDCKLAIYTVAGDLVWEAEHHSQSGNIEWDTRNDSGEIVHSGIYLYKLEDNGGGSVYGRLIIIR